MSIVFDLERTNQLSLLPDKDLVDLCSPIEPYQVTKSRYKEPKKGRNLLVYTIQALSKVGLRQGLVKLSGTSITLPTRVAERIAEVRIVPKCDCYVIEVIYEKTEQFLAPNEKIAAIDLGIDNLMAVTSNQPDFIPLLINGRPLKSLNQFYNQRRAKLQSLLKGNRQSSQRMRRLTRCRNQKIDNYLHRASRYGSSLPFMLNQQTRCQDNILLTQKFRKFLKP